MNIVNLYRKDLWELNDLKEGQILCDNLINNFTEVLSNEYNLKYNDCYVLVQEMSYHAISIFIDSMYRMNFILNKKNNISFTDKIIDFNKLLIEFSNYTDLNSIKMRGTLIKNIGLSQNVKLSSSFYKGVEINELNFEIPLNIFEYYCRVKYKIKRIIKYYYKKISKLDLSSIYSYTNNKYKIGYINCNKNNLFYLKNYLAKKIDDKVIMQDIELINNRCIILFDKLSAKYIYNLIKNKRFEFMNNIILNKELILLLLAFILSKIENLVLDENKLKHKLVTIENYLRKENYHAIFAIGNLWRFKYSLLVISANRLNIPVIEYQNGGGSIYTNRTGLIKNEVVNNKTYLKWGDWKSYDNDKYRNVTKVNNIFNDYYFVKYKNNKINNSKRNILFVPTGFSNLFILEIYNNYDENVYLEHRLYTNDILKLFNEYSDNIKMYVKIKYTSNIIYENYKYYMFPIMTECNYPIQYLYKGSAVHYIHNMDLFITDGLSTTFQESMYHNIPTICIFNDKMMKIKSIYFELFNELYSNGIVVDSINSAKDSIKMFVNNPDYWYDDRIQNLRNEFIGNFSFSSTSKEYQIQSNIESIISNNALMLSNI